MPTLINLLPIKSRALGDQEKIAQLRSNKARYMRKYRKNHPEQRVKHNEFFKKWKLENLEYYKEQQKAYRVLNAGKIKKQKCEYYSKRKKLYKELDLKEKYNLTIEQFNKLYEEQCGNCYICGKKPNKKPLAVDHNHTTGEVRRLLCVSCNCALGLVHDDISILRKLITYLEKYGSANQPNPTEIGGITMPSNPQGLHDPT